MDQFPPEISDLIVSYDPVTLARQPVMRDEVVARFRKLNRSHAAKIVAAMPIDEQGNLCPVEVDKLLIRVHAEIQRLSEEFQQGHRIKALLQPMLSVLRAEGVASPYRIVDVGCGPGYMVRWLAAFGDLGDDVELIGADYNVALIEHARRLAELESLPCHFEVANAFQLTTPGTIYYSIGVIHHFRGDGLQQFFASQEQPMTQAWMHFDIKSSWLAPMGAWLFHRARMREPLARHDGVLSAIRAHPSETLLDAAKSGAPGFARMLFDEDESWLPIWKVMHAVVGVRPALVPGLLKAMGGEVQRLTGGDLS